MIPAKNHLTFKFRHFGNNQAARVIAAKPGGRGCVVLFQAAGWLATRRKHHHHQLVTQSQRDICYNLQKCGRRKLSFRVAPLTPKSSLLRGGGRTQCPTAGCLRSGLLQAPPCTISLHQEKSYFLLWIQFLGMKW